MAKFEAHITLDKIHAPQLKEDDAPLRTLWPLIGWQYSAIDDDPLMGQKPYCYLTAYDPDAQALLRRMQRVARTLELEGISVLRTKVERIIYDSKTGVDELTDLIKE